MSLSSPRAFLTVLSGARRGARVPMSERCVVGTDDSCDFIINDEPASHNERATLDLAQVDSALDPSSTASRSADNEVGAPAPARIRRERDRRTFSADAHPAEQPAHTSVGEWEPIEFEMPFLVGDTLLMLSAPDLEAPRAQADTDASSDSAAAALRALDAEVPANAADRAGTALDDAVATRAVNRAPAALPPGTEMHDETIATAAAPAVSVGRRHGRPRYLAACLCLVLAVGALFSVSMKNFAKGVGAAKPGQQTAASASRPATDAATAQTQIMLERAGLSGLAEVKHLNNKPVVVAFADSPADIGRLRQRLSRLDPSVAYRVEMSAQLLTKVRAELIHRSEQITVRSGGHGRMHLSGVVHSSAHAQALISALNERFPTVSAFEYKLANAGEASLAVAALAEQAGISTSAAPEVAGNGLSIDVDGGMASVTRLTEMLAAHGAHHRTLLPVSVTPRLGGSEPSPGMRPKLIVMGVAPYAVLEDGRRVVVGQRLGQQTVGRISRDRLRLDKAAS